VSLLTTLKSRFSAQAEHMVYAYLPGVDGGESAPLEPYASYFRVFVEEMHLAKSVSWGQQSFPAVHAEVKLRFGGRDETAFSTLARPPEDALAGGVHLNYRVTELLPYSGGTVEISAALVSLPGRNQLGPAIDVLSELTKLVAPPVGQAVPLARELATATRRLLDPWADGVQIGLHRTFVSAGGGGEAIMRPGWIAVIRADAEVFAADSLLVVDHCLHRVPAGGGLSSGLTGYDYMLLRIEGRAERDDWRLADIDAPLKRALAALDEGSEQTAAAYRAVALAAARQSPDIAEGDRPRVIQAIKDEYAAAQGGGRGAVGGELSDLTTVMRTRARSRARAAALGPQSDEELFS
jgi:hypothetical protein